jgi:hypothetical protein
MASLCQIIEKKIRVGSPAEARKFLHFEETEVTAPVMNSFWNDTYRPKTIMIYIVRKKK